MLNGCPLVPLAKPSWVDLKYLSKWYTCVACIWLTSFYESPVDCPDDEFVVFSTPFDALHWSGDVFSVSTAHVRLVSRLFTPMVLVPVGIVYQSLKPSSPLDFGSFSICLLISLDPFYYILLFWNSFCASKGVSDSLSPALCISCCFNFCAVCGEKPNLISKDSFIFFLWKSTLLFSAVGCPTLLLT